MIKAILKWFTPFPIFKLLFLTALLLIASVIVNSLVFLAASNQQERSNQTTLQKTIIESCNRQVSQLLDQIENIESSDLPSICYHNSLHSIAIHQFDGRLLMAKHLSELKPSSKKAKKITRVAELAANIKQSPNTQKIQLAKSSAGYIVYTFKPLNTHTYLDIETYREAFYIASALWLALLLLLISNRIIHRSNYKKQAALAAAQKSEPDSIYSLFRSQLSKRKGYSGTYKLILKAHWESLDKTAKQQLIYKIYQWLNLNNYIFIDIEGSNLVFGLSKKFSEENILSIRVLEAILKEFELKPRLLIHHLEFDSDIYNQFFTVIDDGIWLDETLEEFKHRHLADTTINLDIEIEGYGEVLLCKLAPATRGQRVRMKKAMPK